MNKENAFEFKYDFRKPKISYYFILKDANINADKIYSFYNARICL